MRKVLTTCDCGFVCIRGNFSAPLCVCRLCLDRKDQVNKERCTVDSCIDLLLQATTASVCIHKIPTKENERNKRRLHVVSDESFTFLCTVRCVWKCRYTYASITALSSLVCYNNHLHPLPQVLLRETEREKID